MPPRPTPSLPIRLRWLLPVAVLLLAACGPVEAMREPRRTLPLVKLGSTNFGEQLILAEVYGQALEAKGFRVERQLNLGSREAVEPALEAGRIDLYVEYLATMLAFVTRGAQLGSSDAAATHRQLTAALQPLGISVLDYAPAVNTNGFVVTRATADRYSLAKLSDLAAVAERLTFGGPPECPVRPFCLVGLQQTYGLTFREFRILDTGGPRTVAALDGGQIDVGLLFTTDPLIRARQFVLLEDDRELQLADNVAPVVRSDLLNRAPPEFSATLNEVSSRLTTSELTALNGRVILDGQSPGQAATAWLREQGLARR